jgi:hypothetical protein
VRSIVLGLALLASVAACETSTDPFFGFGATGVTAGQVTGNWSFILHPASGCATGSLPDGQVLTAHLDVLSDGTVTSGTSTWQTANAAGSVSGSINLTSGVTTTVALTATNGSAMELAGTFTSTGSFSGTVGDPRSGSLPVFSVCSYTTTATKTG